MVNIKTENVFRVPGDESIKIAVERTYKQKTDTILVDNKELKNKVIDYISYYGYHCCIVDVIKSVSDLEKINKNNVVIINPEKILQNLLKSTDDQITFISEH